MAEDILATSARDLRRATDHVQLKDLLDDLVNGKLTHLVALDAGGIACLPAPEIPPNTLLLPGSFNPVHEGHEEMARQAAEMLGFAILDSGCGKTIVGRETLNAFHLIWKQHGIPVKPEFKQRNVFRYGNGQQEISETMIDMPIFLASKPGYVRACAHGSQLRRSVSIKVVDFPEGANKLFAQAPESPDEADQEKMRVMEFTARQHRQWQSHPQSYDFADFACRYAEAR
ncbi:Putative transposon protein [Durusdinium trenchii]|uniref:Transposon protein n=1 Tax=Durusdinium trenchii TaxID=1381693 RepID=A0ABP0SBY8_9DINO